MFVLTWPTVGISITNEAIWTGALGLMVDNPAGGKPGTWVIYNARVNTLPVFACIVRRAVLIS